MVEVLPSYTKARCTHSLPKIEIISGKINQKRINDDDATGVQRLMRKPDESLADAKVQGNER